MIKKAFFFIIASITLTSHPIEIDKKVLLAQLDELEQQRKNELKLAPFLEESVKQKFRAQTPPIDPIKNELFKQLDRRLRGYTSMFKTRVLDPIKNLRSTIKKASTKNELIDLAFRVKTLQRELDPHAEILTWLKRYANETLVDAADILTSEAKTKKFFGAITPDYELAELGDKELLEQALADQMGVFRGEFTATRSGSEYSIEKPAKKFVD